MRVNVLLPVALLLLSCSPKISIESKDGYELVHQRGGITLGYSPGSGVQLLYDKGFAFKDLDKDGELDVYEDWRQNPRTRAVDLASKLSIEQIAGLMLYSKHQAVPTDSEGYWSSTYNGVKLEESGLPLSALSDAQKQFLSEDNLRAVLVVRVENPRIAAEWNNNLQAFCETLGYGIPVNISSDPRHEAEAWGEFNAGSGGQISQWPCQLGLAASFEPELVRRFGEIAAREYRAMGIATALSPQADLGTEPRWFRFYGTFGEDANLATDMVRAYVDGFQTSSGKAEIAGGWGFHSVNTMVKHWPGGGTGEGGRDAHFSYGKYSVYPARGLEYQLKPFVEGAFKLKGKTAVASAVMPYYTISYGIDPSGQNVGNGFSEYIVKDMLREGYGYDEVVCTDWGITHEHIGVEHAVGKPWGVESLNEAERHYQVLKAGVDQFGGNNDSKPILEAYKMWVEEFGEQSARQRFEHSAVRLLMNMLRPGLFDNPYVDPAETEALVGCPEYMAEGYAAQLKAVVMLKNKALPVDKKAKLYFPMRHITPSKAFFGQQRTDDCWEYPMDTTMVSKFYELVSSPEEADFAFVYIGEPSGGNGYSVEDREAGGNGYLPISLQYGTYCASDARSESLAGGDPFEDFSNRSYKDKTVTSYNSEDLELVKTTKSAMGDKPVVVGVGTLRPFVCAEIEPYADALLLGINVHHQALMDIISGNAEPKGLLPMQMPSSMAEVEKQAEDAAADMKCYVDSEGHSYDFAYGLDWNGVINDKRSAKYRRK